MVYLPPAITYVRYNVCMKGVIGIVVVSLILTILYVVVRPEPEVPDGYSRLPVVDTHATQETNGQMAVFDRNGNELIVQDVTDDASALNDVTYEFSGDTPQLEKDFNLTFYQDQSYFLVSLLKEPLGETRIAAETALKAALGVSQEQLCELNVSVRTDMFTNQFYAGNELGVSSCPGAIQLP